MNYCRECGNHLETDQYGYPVEKPTTMEVFKRIADSAESIVVLLQEAKESNVNASSLVIEYGKQFRSEMQREVGALAEQARLAAMESVTAEFRPVTTKSGEHISILDFELKKKPKKHTLRAKK